MFFGWMSRMELKVTVKKTTCCYRLNCFPTLTEKKYKSTIGENIFNIESKKIEKLLLASIILL